MSKNIKKEENVSAKDVALSKGENFLAQHKTKLIGAVVAVVAVIVVILGYNNLVKVPREKTALEQMATAERYFGTDSFNIALNGDGINPGFIQIIDDYGSTKASQLARFYAGYCNLYLGNFEAAISQLDDFDANDEVFQARALCGIGDAYTELEQYDKAVLYFIQAADYRDNEFSASYLMKAGITYEQLGKFADALNVYEKIKTHYSRTAEAQEIDKYIERAKIKQN